MMAAIRRSTLSTAVIPRTQPKRIYPTQDVNSENECPVLRHDPITRASAARQSELFQCLNFTGCSSVGRTMCQLSKPVDIKMQLSSVPHGGDVLLRQGEKTRDLSRHQKKVGPSRRQGFHQSSGPPRRLKQSSHVVHWLITACADRSTRGRRYHGSL
jgi:hypothetical protein